MNGAKNSRPIQTSEVNRLAAELVTRLAALTDYRTATVRAVRRELSRQLTIAPPEVVIQLALKLIKRGDIVKRFVAYELVQHHKGALQSLDAQTLEHLGQGIDSWSTVDAFSCYLAGPAWREHEVSDKLIHSWARSKDRWWRRAALVATVPLNSKARGGNGDAARTLQVCHMLIDDRDDMVVKALSWALRELSKRNPGSVRMFVEKHKHALAPRVVREVNNKLLTGLKNPRR